MSKWAFLVCSIFLSSSVASELLVTAPPLQSKIELERSFRPFVRALSSALDQQVVYKYPKSWLQYSHEIKSDNYDLVLSEAHILSLLLLFQNSGGLAHLPLATVQTEKSLHLVTTELDIETPKQLINKKICVKPSPSIDAVHLYSLFSNPVSQPQILEITGNYLEVQQALIDKQCSAAVLQIQGEGTPDTLQSIHTFTSTPQLGWTLSSKLPPATQQQIRDFFFAPENREYIDNIFALLTESEEAQTFSTFAPEKYANYHELLSKVWGW